jgi:hypothetical protein
MPIVETPKSVVMERLSNQIDLSTIPIDQHDKILSDLYDDFFNKFKVSSINKIEQIEEDKHSEKLSDITHQIEDDVVYSLKYTSVMGIAKSIESLAETQLDPEKFTDFQKQLFLITTKIDSDARLKESEVKDATLDSLLEFLSEYSQAEDVVLTMPEMQDIIANDIKKNVLREVEQLQSAENDLLRIAHNFNDSSVSIETITKSSRTSLESLSLEYPSISINLKGAEDVFSTAFNPVLNDIFKGYSKQYESLSKKLTKIRIGLNRKVKKTTSDQIFSPVRVALESLDQISSAFMVAKNKSGTLAEDTFSDKRLLGLQEENLTYAERILPNINPRINTLLSNTYKAMAFNTAAAILIGVGAALMTGGISLLPSIIPAILPIIGSTIMKTAIAVPIMTVFHDLLGLSKDGVIKPDSDFNSLMNIKGPAGYVPYAIGWLLKNLSLVGKGLDHLDKKSGLVRFLSITARFATSFLMWGTLISQRDTWINGFDYVKNSINPLLEGLSSFDLFAQFESLTPYIDAIKDYKFTIGTEDNVFPLLVEMMQERVRHLWASAVNAKNNLKENIKLEVEDFSLKYNKASILNNNIINLEGKLHVSHKDINSLINSFGSSPPNKEKFNELIANFNLASSSNSEKVKIIKSYIDNTYENLNQDQSKILCDALLKHSEKADIFHNSKDSLADFGKILPKIASIVSILPLNNGNVNITTKDLNVVDASTNTNITLFLKNFKKSNPVLAPSIVSLEKSFEDKKISINELLDKITELKFA